MAAASDCSSGPKRAPAAASLIVEQVTGAELAVEPVGIAKPTGKFIVVPTMSEAGCGLPHARIAPTACPISLKTTPKALKAAT